jgi:hypothetical protein
VAASFLDRFAEKEPRFDGGMKHSRTPLLADKLLLHVLVLALTITGFKMEAKAISSDLKLPVQKYILHTIIVFLTLAP